jgi:hypothetical protein
MKKKGDLSLSMNAIVVLIMAITLLGLGLGFMRGLFSNMTTKVGQAIDANDLTTPPNPDNQVTVTPSDFTMKDKSKITVAFLNTYGGAENNCGIIADADLSCQTKQEDCDSVPVFTWSIEPVKMIKDQIVAWTVAISGPTGSDDNAGDCTFLCTAKITCDESASEHTKDFILTLSP